jgi:hypothetical protein
MMTTPFELDLSQITQAMSSLTQQLPQQSELVQRLNQNTLLWTATVQEALIRVAVQQCLQLIETEEQNAKPAALNPILEQIKNILLPALNPEHQMVPSTTSAPPPVSGIQPPIQPPSPVVVETEKPVQPDKPVQRANILNEKTARQYCWELAHCVDLTDSIGELDELRQRTAPTDQPQTGDIVLHGTVSKTSAPVWIAPIETIPAFSQLTDILSVINLKGQIWLDFSDIYTTRQPLDLAIPKWCEDYPDTHLLWQRWIDLLYWTVMAPDYSVFITKQQQQLSTDRQNILKTLLTIHKDFAKGFNEPEKYQENLGNNLHKLYAVFHQFLRAEDMRYNAVPKHVFANLRRCVANNISAWQKPLSIHEEHSTGPLNVRNRATKEYLASVAGSTDNANNIQLPLHHPFSQQINAEKNQVLYWTRPYWKQPQLPTTHHYFDLKGSVLYCYH